MREIGIVQIRGINNKIAPRKFKSVSNEVKPKNLHQYLFTAFRDFSKDCQMDIIFKNQIWRKVTSENQINTW